VFTDTYLYPGLRTPFGRHGGGLSPMRPDDLMATAIAAVIARSGCVPSDVDDVVIGCTNQAGEDCRNVGRRAALLAGLPVEVPGITVNRLCASGLAAIIDAGRAVSCKEGDLFVAGGVESMSRAPFVLAKSDRPFQRDYRMFDSTTGSRFPNDRLTAQHGDDSMPDTADTVGRELGIGRAASDGFALGSQEKYARALADGFFAEEILPVEVPRDRGAVVTVTTDEQPRGDTTLARLAALKPLTPGGVVTAGNASGINDGAAAVIVGSRRVAERTGREPLARLVSSAVAGVAPRVMGLGPVPAIRTALERAGLTLADVDVIEINEAFATQVLGCLQLLQIDPDDVRVNPNGGAIAVGHPLGASGARLAITAARQLQRSRGRYAVVALCIGVGQGLALVLERA
jgi:acetyl-CoA C-acetyltransferase